MSDWNTEQEIRQQPAVWGAWGEAFSNDLAELQNWIAQCEVTEVWLCGAGTSAFIGDVAASGLNPTSRLPIRAVPTTDLVASPRLFWRPDVRPLVISFGRSGDSAESIGTLDILDAHFPEAPRINVTCNANSVLATRTGQNQRVIVLPPATHDVAFAMTTSFSTMLLTAIGLLDSTVTSQRDVFADRLRALSNAGETLLPTANLWAVEQEKPSRLVVLGSGPLTYAARESALKVMELSAGKIPSLWESMLGFRHGPKSFVDDQTAIVGFMSSDPHCERYDNDLMTELEEQFPHVTKTRIGPTPTADLLINSELSDVWNVVLYVMVAQLLAVHWAKSMNINVDDPFEGQSTLTRVVSGVTLYPLESVDA